VQSVERAEDRAAPVRQRPERLPPLNVLLQVNISGEAAKRRRGAGELAALARRGGRPAGGCACAA